MDGIEGCSLTAESSKVLILYLASERFYEIFNMPCPGYGSSIFKRYCFCSLSIFLAND